MSESSDYRDARRCRIDCNHDGQLLVVQISAPHPVGPVSELLFPDRIANVARPQNMFNVSRAEFSPTLLVSGVAAEADRVQSGLQQSLNRRGHFRGR